MRPLLLGAAALLTVACGKSARETPDRSELSGAGGDIQGGQPGESGASSSTSGMHAGGQAGERAPGAGGVAGTESNAGGRSNGGAPAGGAENVAGDSSGGEAAGATGASDDAGAGGTGPDECGQYDACGCGCCSETPMTTSCYYPEIGERLSTIRNEDQAAGASPDCEFAGCSLGTRHVCCTTPPLDDAATYGVTGYTNDASHHWIQRENSEGRCTELHLVVPDPGPTPFPLELPENFAFEAAYDYACDSAGGADAAQVKDPIGILGWLRHEMGCMDFDFTVFFMTESGVVDPVRFQAQRVATSGSSERCP
jgi:hypothetical protein